MEGTQDGSSKIGGGLGEIRSNWRQWGAKKGRGEGWGERHLRDVQVDNTFHGRETDKQESKGQFQPSLMGPSERPPMVRNRTKQRGETIKSLEKEDISFMQAAFGVGHCQTLPKTTEMTRGKSIMRFQGESILETSAA